ncbi:hypothetical protein SCP_0105070 [Sparassis crispa]|uniref:Uncharacterized protein n=1 Tax=Sparassis crispa TaxID=139825 RepID=A0A401G653_9APHY|nr:hypothetical protein SCP_0105070 [Sparassis crispa]GBE77627.1 hypothetical protein SCP_0105070 [Sparassis crispa]
MEQYPHRRASNWEVLEGLDELNPPSPSPSLEASTLFSLCSSGEIPIFLHTETDCGDFLLQEEEFQEEHFLIQSPSSSSSVNFTAHDVDYGNSLRFSSPTGSAHGSPVVSGRMTPVCSVPSSPAVESPFLSSHSFYEYQQHTSAESVAYRGSSSGLFRSPGSSTILSTALFGSGSLLSPSPSIVTADVNYAVPGVKRDGFSFRRHQKTKSISPLSEAGGRSRSPSPMPHNAEVSSAPVTPVVASFDIRLPPSPRTAFAKNGVRPTSSARSSRISSPLASPSSKSPNIPGILGWLREIELEFWIDQEGSRTMWPTFTLVGYSSEEASDDRNVDLVNALTYGAAHFRPVKRQAFVLRRGTLDTPLVLRRLTLAGDGSKDYISRQASLRIDSNGVYVVRGTELFEHHPNSSRGYVAQSRQEPLKLSWRFEYRVDDRISEYGTLAPGEKSFTPVGFWCSPALLHPTHGKKTKLIQVFKKNLGPRLSSEKLGVSSASLITSDDKENEAYGAAQIARRPSLEHRRAISGPGVLLDCGAKILGVHGRESGRPASIMIPS